MAPADSWMSAAVTHHEILLSDLAEELAVLMTSRRTADDPLRSLVERTLDDAEEFLADACDWLPTAPVQVVRMALRVADRVQEVRTLLASPKTRPVPGDGLFGDRWPVGLVLEERP
jgi:hypothetical protein